MEQNVLSLIAGGLWSSLYPIHILLTTIGVAAGICVGALPGLTATMAVALLVPVTFTMNPESGLVLLGGIWCGAIYGGSNAAILLNIPGTPSSVATTFDGYPLTKKGDADKALLTSLVASVIGGLIGVIILLSAFAPLAMLSLKFGKQEYFWLCIFGLTTISAMSSSNIAKGLLGASLGLLLCTIGLDPIAGTPRFTFGSYTLLEGIQLVPALIGIFALAQMLTLMERDEKFIAQYKKTKNLIAYVTGKIFRSFKTILLRSSILGAFVGMLPGAGGPVGSIIAYNEAMRWDKEPEKYGKGALEGIVASESANNAVIGGALVPMMGLGIPGCPAAAVVMGGLLVHGIIPGSKLLVESGHVAYTFICSLIIANLIMLVVGYFMMRASAYILKVPARWIAPIILVFSVIGSYALRNSMADVYVMIGCGILSYLLSKVGVDPGPFSLGLVLGTIAEDALGVSLVIGQAKGSVLSVLFLRPISIVLIILSILSALTPLLLSARKKRARKNLALIKEK